MSSPVKKDDIEKLGRMKKASDAKLKAATAFLKKMDEAKSLKSDLANAASKLKSEPDKLPD